MINDIIIKLIESFSDIYTRIGLHTLISNLIGYLDDWQSYSTLFNEYLSGVYFLFGKALVVYIVGVFAVVIVIRIAFAIVNLIGQFVP